MPQSGKQRVPVFMRIGHKGKEHQVGWVELVPDQFDINNTTVEDLLREAADQLAEQRRQQHGQTTSSDSDTS